MIYQKAVIRCCGAIFLFLSLLSRESFSDPQITTESITSVFNQLVTSARSDLRIDAHSTQQSLESLETRLAHLTVDVHGHHISADDFMRSFVRELRTHGYALGSEQANSLEAFFSLWGHLLDQAPSTEQNDQVGSPERLVLLMNSFLSKKFVQPFLDRQSRAEAQASRSVVENRVLPILEKITRFAKERQTSFDHDPQKAGPFLRDYNHIVDQWIHILNPPASEQNLDLRDRGLTVIFFDGLDAPGLMRVAQNVDTRVRRWFLRDVSIYLERLSALSAILLSRDSRGEQEEQRLEELAPLMGRMTQKCIDTYRSVVALINQQRDAGYEIDSETKSSIIGRLSNMLTHNAVPESGGIRRLRFLAPHEDDLRQQFLEALDQTSSLDELLNYANNLAAERGYFSSARDNRSLTVLLRGVMALIGQRFRESETNVGEFILGPKLFPGEHTTIGVHNVLKLRSQHASRFLPLLLTDLGSSEESWPEYAQVNVLEDLRRMIGFLNLKELRNVSTKIHLGSNSLIGTNRWVFYDNGESLAGAETVFLEPSYRTNRIQRNTLRTWLPLSGISVDTFLHTLTLADQEKRRLVFSFLKERYTITDLSPEMFLRGGPIEDRTREMIQEPYLFNSSERDTPLALAISGHPISIKLMSTGQRALLIQILVEQQESYRRTRQETDAVINPEVSSYFQRLMASHHYWESSAPFERLFRSFFDGINPEEQNAILRVPGSELFEFGLASLVLNNEDESYAKNLFWKMMDFDSRILSIHFGALATDKLIRFGQRAFSWFQERSTPLSDQEQRRFSSLVLNLMSWILLSQNVDLSDQVSFLEKFQEFLPRIVTPEHADHVVTFFGHIMKLGVYNESLRRGPNSRIRSFVEIGLELSLNIIGSMTINQAAQEIFKLDVMGSPLFYRLGGRQGLMRRAISLPPGRLRRAALILALPPQVKKYLCGGVLRAIFRSPRPALPTTTSERLDH